MSLVTREKYDTLKEKAAQWIIKYNDKLEDYEQLQEDYEQLQEEYEQFQEEYEQLQEKTVQIEQDNEELQHALCMVSEPEQYSKDEYEKLHIEINCLQKKNRIEKENHKKESSDLDRQILKKDGEIYNLKASLEDYKERYKEYRDEVLMIRNNNRLSQL